MAISEVKNEHLTIFPNPTPGVFHVSTNVSPHEPVSLSIYDAMGKEIVTMVKEELVQDSYTISLFNQPPGIYFIRLTTQEGIISRKIIVQ